MLADVIFLLADPYALGRIDEAYLPEQTLIELPVSEFNETTSFYNKNGDFLDIGSMNVIVECDSEGNVDAFDTAYRFIGGTIGMRWLPPSLKRIDIYGNNFEGSFDAKWIPSCTRFVRLQKNKLTGGVCLVLLSSELRYLNLSENQLSGTVDFVNLPKTLEVFSIAKNNFNGEIDLRRVTKTLTLDLSGSFNLRFWKDKEIPELESKMILNLAENKFDGDVRVHNIDKVERLNIFSHTECTEMVDIDGSKRSLRTLF